MSLSLAQDLRSVRSLIENLDRWTRDTLARDASGEGVDPLDRSATCFCLDGAAIYTTKGCHSERYQTLSRALMQANGGHNYADFNDVAEHADVLVLIDTAIAEASR